MSNLVPASIEKKDLNLQKSSFYGETLVLECPVSGDPMPAITWLKDGNVNFDNNKNIEILHDGRILQIISSEDEDAGNYVCRAENKGGFQEIEYNVNIFGEVAFENFIWTVSTYYVITTSDFLEL